MAAKISFDPYGKLVIDRRVSWSSEQASPGRSTGSKLFQPYIYISVARRAKGSGKKREETLISEKQESKTVLVVANDCAGDPVNFAEGVISATREGNNGIRVTCPRRSTRRPTAGTEKFHTFYARSVLRAALLSYLFRNARLTVFPRLSGLRNGRVAPTSVKVNFFCIDASRLSARH